MRQELQQLAQDLAAAWRSGSTIPLPAKERAPASRAEAYAVQDRMAGLIGGAIAGWKVGATVKAVQRFEGHDGPLPGRVFLDRCLESPARLPAAAVTGAKIECEFAMRLNEDAPSALTAETLAPLLAFHPAFELSASRYSPGTGDRAATTLDGIADNGSGGAAVYGPAITDWRDLAFETMDIDARIDVSPPLQTYAPHYRRHPLEVAVETFAGIRARGFALPAGTILLTGSLTLPTPLRKGQSITARFANFTPMSLTLT